MRAEARVEGKVGRPMLENDILEERQSLKNDVAARFEIWLLSSPPGQSFRTRAIHMCNRARSLRGFTVGTTRAGVSDTAEVNSVGRCLYPIGR